MGRGPAWTAEQRRALVRWWGVVPLAEVAKRVGRSVVSITKAAHTFGLGSPNNRQGYLSLSRFSEESGYGPVRILNAAKHLGLRLGRLPRYQARLSDCKYNQRWFAITLEQQEEILTFLKAHPDAERLHRPGRLRDGEWGGSRPCCARCGTTEKPHHAHGLCSPCEGARYREAKRKKKRSKSDERDQKPQGPEQEQA